MFFQSYSMFGKSLIKLDCYKESSGFLKYSLNLTCKTRLPAG